MFTGELNSSWIALLLAALLFLLDFFYWKRFRKKIQVAIPWNIFLVFLIAFAGTGLFCIGLALRIFFGDLTSSFGSAENWLIIGLLFFICAAICGYLHKKEEERNRIPLSQIPLLPAKIQRSTEPLMLPVHLPRQNQWALIENPKKQPQRFKKRWVQIGIIAVTISLLWLGFRLLPTANLTTLLTNNLPLERAIPTPTSRPDHSLVSVLVAPQKFFSAAATTARATFMAPTPSNPPRNFVEDNLTSSHVAAIAPSELESAVTTADLSQTISVANANGERNSDGMVDDTGSTAIIAIGGPIESNTEEKAPLPETTVIDNVVPQPFNVVIQSEYGANIRSHPGIDGEIITALPAGISLVAIGRNADSQWIRIRLAVSTGAWVAAEVVDDGSTLFAEGLAALPITE